MHLRRSAAETRPLDATAATGGSGGCAPENPWTVQMETSDGQIELEVIISNKQGLHARPVMRFVDLASQFSSAIQVCKADRCVDGKSPMEMMLLEATQGTILKLRARGEDSRQAVEALAELVRSKFGEE